MPLPKINFRQIRGHGATGSAADGFEELATELIEEELVSWPVGTRFERFGNPDGGREGRALLPNGEVWAWQAKFLFALGADELSQIGESIIRALDCESGLSKYFVLMPYDLPAGDTSRSKSAHTKWEERVAAWTALAAEKGMSVQFEYIGAHRLIAALTQGSQVGRLRYWFDVHAFDPSWFADIANRAAIDAGPRYQQELNVDLPIAGVFAGLGQTAEFERSVRERLATLRSARRFEWRSPKAHEAVFSPLIEDANAALSQLDATLGSIISHIGLRPDGVPYVAEALWAVGDALDPIDEKLVELCRQDGDYYVDDAGSLYSSIRKVWSLLSDLGDLSDRATWRSAQRRLLVLIGAGGNGKTHLLCDVARVRSQDGLPTIVLLGQHFDTRAPLVQMSELLHFGGAPDELLPTLNAAAQAAGRRGLVIIDALNEAHDPAMWQEHLGGLVRDVLKQPWLALVVSCRTPYLDLVIPPGVLAQGAVVEHYGFQEATPDAVTRYLEYFGLEAPGFPLLDPELANPLFLRLLCEALQSQGERCYPRERPGLQWLYDAYLQSIDKRLGSSSRCDYDYRDRLSWKTVRELAKSHLETGDAPTPRRGPTDGGTASGTQVVDLTAERLAGRRSATCYPASRQRVHRVRISATRRRRDGVPHL